MARRENTKYRTDEIAGVKLDELSPDKIPETLFNKFGGKELAKQGAGTIGRDFGFMLSRFVSGWIDKAKLLEKGANLLEEKELEIPDFGIVEGTNLQKAQLITKGLLDATVVVSEAGIIAAQNDRDDRKIRAEIKQELQPYLDAGLKGIRFSSALPNFGSGNALLDTLDNRLQAQYNQGLFQAASSLLISGAQYASRKFDVKDQEKAIDAIAEDHNNHVEKGSGKGQTFIVGENEIAKQKAAIKERPFNEVLRNPVINFKNLGEKHKIHENGPYLSRPILSVIGAAALTGTIQKRLDDTIKDVGSKVIAYDLIVALDEYIAKEDAAPKTIDLNKLNLPKNHRFLTLDKQKPAAFEKVIEEIFQQHVCDQSGERIGKRSNDKLAMASQAVADAITGKSTDEQGNAMHPMALIKLVGEGKIVAHDGYGVEHMDVVEAEISQARRLMPDVVTLDVDDYMHELDMPVERFKTMVDSLPDSMQNFVLNMIPNEVGQEKLGKSNKVLLLAESESKATARDTLKAVVEDLASKSDTELKMMDVLPQQIKLINEVAKDIENGNMEALDVALNQNGTDDLHFAVLGARGYWKEVAKGHEPGTWANTSSKDDGKASDAEKEPVQSEAKKPKAEDSKESKKEKDSSVDVANDNDKDELIKQLKQELKKAKDKGVTVKAPTDEEAEADKKASLKSEKPESKVADKEHKGKVEDKELVASSSR